MEEEEFAELEAQLEAFREKASLHARNRRTASPAGLMVLDKRGMPRTQAGERKTTKEFARSSVPISIGWFTRVQQTAPTEQPPQKASTTQKVLTTESEIKKELKRGVAPHQLTQREREELASRTEKLRHAATEARQKKKRDTEEERKAKAAKHAEMMRAQEKAEILCREETMRRAANLYKNYSVNETDGGDGGDGPEYASKRRQRPPGRTTEESAAKRLASREAEARAQATLNELRDYVRNLRRGYLESNDPLTVEQTQRVKNLATAVPEGNDKDYLLNLVKDMTKF